MKRIVISILVFTVWCGVVLFLADKTTMNDFEIIVVSSLMIYLPAILGELIDIKDKLGKD